jgi:2-methylcitrate dehydratase
VITAIVLAYEIFCRLSDQVHAGELGWDQGMFGVVGAACAAGKVLGLSREHMAQAISLAIVPNLPLGVTRVGELPMWKGCAAASATRAGIFAAQLAQQGMTGPAEPFDGRRGLWEQAVGAPVSLPPWQGDGTPWRIMATHFKRFPCQIHTQGPISLALDLRPRVALPEIAALHIYTYATAVHSAATEPEKWAPQTRETADHSIPYLVAVAFRDGTVTPGSFTAARLRDPALRSLMDVMTVTEDPDYTKHFPAAFPCRLEVTTMSGQRLTAEALYPQGHAHNPLSDVEVEEKFQRLTADLMPASQCRTVFDLLWSVEHQANLQALFDSLVLTTRPS